MYTQPENLLLYKRERERKYREKQNKETLLYKFGHTAAKRRLFIVNQSPPAHPLYSFSYVSISSISSIEKRDECIWAQPFLLIIIIIIFFFFQNVYGAIESPVKRLDTQQPSKPKKQHSLINRFLWLLYICKPINNLFSLRQLLSLLCIHNFTLFFPHSQQEYQHILSHSKGNSIFFGKFLKILTAKL